MDYFKQLFKNISEFVKAMSPSQAIMLIGVIAGIIVGGLVVTTWLSTAHYSTLYSNLDPSEAGEIVSYLSDQGIPYELSGGGGTISIPSGEVYKVRISLAAEGMPRTGNIGYSIFDQSNLGMTEFLQNLNFRRALEGELMRTIMQLSDVQAARVHIVMPKDRLFREEQKEATASVVLKLKRPDGLSKSQLAGISHLVASSVEGLRPENISIIDYNGNLLSSEMKQDALAGLSSSQLEVRKNVEQYLEEKAQSMLDGVIGRGKSIVRVTAELDFQQVEKTNEMYDPNSAVVRSQEKIDESSTVSDKSEEELAESTDETSSETTVTNYEINKTVEHIVNSVGNIRRLSVAVLLDGEYKEVEGEGGQQIVYEPRPQDEIDRISAIVKNAVGFDADRADQIEVTNLAFDRSSMEYEQDKLDIIYQQEFLFEIAKNVGIVLLIIAVALYLRKKIRRLFASLKRFLPPVKPPPPLKPAKQQVHEYEEEEEELPEPPKRKPRLVDQMKEQTKDRPEEITKIIKTLMVD